MSSYLFLQVSQRSFAGLNLLQHGFILHSREGPHGGVHLTPARAILLLTQHLLGLAVILQSHTKTPATTRQGRCLVCKEDTLAKKERKNKSLILML